MTVTLDTSDIQGNILKGYRFPHAAHLFGWVEAANVAQWRTFLRTVAKQVTVAQWQDKPRALEELRPPSRVHATATRDAPAARAGLLVATGPIHRVTTSALTPRRNASART